MNKEFSLIQKGMSLFALTCVIFLSFSCKVQQNAGAGYAAGRKMLLRDEGLSQISYVDLANPSSNWYMKVPLGRDLQLIGNGLVLVPTSDGYEEHDIKTGSKVKELTTFPGTQTARKLKNGNMLMIGLNYSGKKGVCLTEIDKAGAVKKELNFPEYDYVRMVRETAAGTYLVTCNKTILESTTDGKVVWKAQVTGGPAKTNSWQAIRLANGNTVVAGGYTGNLQVFDKEGKQLSIITGPAEVHPEFFAGLQVLPNGNYVVANWQGHGPNYGASGHQVVEYTPDGKLAWSWKQYADKISSVQGVLVLDGLDIGKTYVENGKGVLEAVK